MSDQDLQNMEREIHVHRIAEYKSRRIQETIEQARRNVEVLTRTLSVMPTALNNQTDLIVQAFLNNLKILNDTKDI